MRGFPNSHGELPCKMPVWPFHCYPVYKGCPVCWIIFSQLLGNILVLGAKESYYSHTVVLCFLKEKWPWQYSRICKEAYTTPAPFWNCCAFNSGCSKANEQEEEWLLAHSFKAAKCQQLVIRSPWLRQGLYLSKNSCVMCATKQRKAVITWFLSLLRTRERNGLMNRLHS